MEMDGSDDFPLQRDDFQVSSWFLEVYQESFSERFQSQIFQLQHCQNVDKTTTLTSLLYN